LKRYVDDAEIVRSIADFYEEGSGAGETLVLVATAAHRQAVEATLAARRLDLGTAYVALRRPGDPQRASRPGCGGRRPLR